jgi:hypothetical protein
LALYLDDEKAAAEAVLAEGFKLPAAIKGAVEKVTRVRSHASLVQAEALEFSAEVAKKLTAAGYSTRDAADLIGVSHQLVHQYANAVASAPRAARATSAPRAAKAVKAKPRPPTSRTVPRPAAKKRRSAHA